MSYTLLWQQNYLLLHYGDSPAFNGAKMAFRGLAALVRAAVRVRRARAAHLHPAAPDVPAQAHLRLHDLPPRPVFHCSKTWHEML